MNVDILLQLRNFDRRKTASAEIAAFGGNFSATEEIQKTFLVKYAFKAQVSLEYLLLFLVSLSLISFSMAALIQLKSGSEKNVEAIGFRSSSNSLFNTINEICALGNGNGREILLSTEFEVEFLETTEGKMVRFSNLESPNNPNVARASIVKKVFCEVEPNDKLSGTVYVENNKGKIIFIAR
jgi:hypothetical protein